jgi:hypothetical protein
VAVDSVILPNGRIASRIGFGCGSLRGGGESAASRALVVAALDAGIRHFDLAPSYGLGMAEDIVGQVLVPLRREVTITTKVGIARPRFPGLLTGVRRIAKPALARFPALWNAVASNVRTAASPRDRFEPDFVRASVAESLRHLGADTADILLMHEMVGNDVTPDLLSALDDLTRRGSVNLLGLGGDRGEGMRIAKSCPALGQVMQFRWNVFEPSLVSRTGSLFITHGAIRPALDRMMRLTQALPELAIAWSARLDADLADWREICDLLLAAALAENAHGIVLVASQNPSHIRRVAEVAADRHLIAKGARFRDLVGDYAVAGIAGRQTACGTLLDGEVRS